MPVKIWPFYKTFLEIIENFKTVGNYSQIDGIGYRENSEIKFTRPRVLNVDIDNFPDPMRSITDSKDYVGISFSRGYPNTEMIVSRGCPYRCVFCANPVFLSETVPFRKRSPKLIRDEVDQLYKDGFREISLHSDEVNVDLNWAIEVCKELASLNYKDLYFQCYLRVVPMSKELAVWMKKANFWMVRIGIESANERVLKGIKKHVTIPQIESACKILSEHGIKVWAYFLIYNVWENNNELKYESDQEIQNSLNFGFRLWRKRHLHYSSWMFPMPVHGSELYNICRKYDLIDSEFYPNDRDWNPTMISENITSSQYKRFYKKAKFLQALMAISSGAIEFRNWRKILHSIKIFFR